MIERNENKTEEILNIVTHTIGSMLSIAALTLVSTEFDVQNKWKDAGAMFFSISMILFFTGSVISHIPFNKFKKISIKNLQNLAIFILFSSAISSVVIAITGKWGFGPSAFLWALVLLSIIFQTVFASSGKEMNLILNTATTWLIFISVIPMLSKINSAFIGWLAASTICYSSSLFFLINKKIRLRHALWHALSLIGSIFHFIGLYFYLR